MKPQDLLLILVLIRDIIMTLFSGLGIIITNTVYGYVFIKSFLTKNLL